jgi:hypothetical protein
MAEMRARGMNLKSYMLRNSKCRTDLAHKPQTRAHPLRESADIDRRSVIDCSGA